jgi:hypothetical protein
MPEGKIPNLPKGHDLARVLRVCVGMSNGRIPIDGNELLGAMDDVRDYLTGPPKGKMVVQWVPTERLPAPTCPTAEIAPVVPGSGLPSEPFVTAADGHTIVDSMVSLGVIDEAQAEQLHREVNEHGGKGKLPWTYLGFEAEQKERDQAAAAELRRKIEGDIGGLPLPEDFEDRLIRVAQAAGIPLSAIKASDIRTSMIPLGLGELLDGPLGPFGDLFGSRRSRRRTWRDDLGGDDDPTPPRADHRSEDAHPGA